MLRRFVREVLIPFILLAALGFVLGFAWAGCSLPQDRGSTIEQQQRETVAGRSTSDIVERVLSHPTPAKLSFPGPEGAMITLEIPETRDVQRRVGMEDAENSDSAASGMASAWTSVPALIAYGVGLICIAVGLWMLYMLFKKSSAIRAAWAVSEGYIEQCISPVRGMAQAETDPARSALLNSIISNMEATKAEFNKD